MFLPWSFFQLNIFFLALETLVAFAFAAGLAHISRIFRNYTHSIRWIQQAGFMEMVKALKNSSGIVSRRPWLALFATFIGGYALTAILAGAKYFAVISTGERNPSHEVVVSKQFVSVSVTTTLPALSVSVPYNTGMEDTLAGALNTTNVVPQTGPKKRYWPRLSDYDLACNRLNLNIPANIGNVTLFLPNAGCANFAIFPSSTMDTTLTGSYIVQESKSRSKIVMTGKSSTEMPFGTVGEAAFNIRLRMADRDFCILMDKIPQMIFATRIGISSPPLTVMTRCQQPSGEMVNIAASTVRFSVPDSKMFHSITTSIFEAQDDLMSSMEASVNNGTLISQSMDPLAQVAVMEVKIIGTEVSVLMCIGSKQGSVPRLVCVYAIVNVLITKPRPENPDITQKMPEKRILPAAPLATVIMTLHHLPAILQNKPSFAIPKILNSSSIAAAYMASLGQNFIVDWEASTLYVAYETVEIIKGYEIPAGLFYSMIGVMVVCVLFWATTEYFVESRYKRSLFWQVSQALASPVCKDSPQLHWFDAAKLAFEGRRIVSTEVPQTSER